MADEGNIRVERFNGTNFEFWKMQIGDYPYQKNLNLPLSQKVQKLKEMSECKWDILDQKARGDLIISVINDCIQRLHGGDDPRLDDGPLEDIQETLSFK